MAGGDGIGRSKLTSDRDAERAGENHHTVEEYSPQTEPLGVELFVRRHVVPAGERLRHFGDILVDVDRDALGQPDG